MKDYYELLKLREEHIENTRKKDIIKVEAQHSCQLILRNIKYIYF